MNQAEFRCKVITLYRELINSNLEGGTSTPDTPPTSSGDTSMFTGDIPQSAIIVQVAPINRVHIFVRGSGWQTLISSDPI